MEATAQPFRTIGVILSIVGLLLLCSVLVSIFLQVPLGIIVAQTGLLAASVGIHFLLDTIDVSYRIESHILNTSGWQISMMYSVYLLGIMTKDLVGLVEPGFSATAVNSIDFIKAIRTRLEASLA